MPAKKGTRSARSTKQSKIAPSSDLVLDENSAAIVAKAGTKSAEIKKSQKGSKKVLGEQNPSSQNVDETSSVVEESSAESAGTIKKTAKSKKGKSATAVTQNSRKVTPEPTSPSKKRLPEDQIQAFLQNYDLEAQARLSRLRASLEISVQSSITRMSLAIDRIPRAVRELSLADFIDEYGADIHNFMGRAPVQHLEEGRKEWEQIKEERSPVKSKRTKKEEAERGAKSARRTNATARSSIGSTAPSVPAKTSAAATKKKAAGASRSTAATRTTRNVPTSPPPVSSASSSMPAPSLSTFKPDIPKQATQTPKPRMAKPGEMIQWQSINGSPICGIIGEDGMVRPVTFATK